MLDSPFLIKLHSAFQDEQFCYFLLELGLRGSLWDQLERSRRFNEEYTRFSTGCTFCSFFFIFSFHAGNKKADKVLPPEFLNKIQIFSLDILMFFFGTVNSSPNDGQKIYSKSNRVYVI